MFDGCSSATGRCQGSRKNVWKRSEVVRVQAIEFAGYACEINCRHKSFVEEKGKKHTWKVIMQFQCVCNRDFKTVWMFMQI